MKNNKKKYDVLVIGELNVDIIFNDINSLPKVGTEILANQMTLTLGSSSAIFASNLSSLGAKVAFIGRVGDDIFGNLVLELLRNKNVDTSMIIRDDLSATGATVGLNYSNDRAMITYAGAMEHLLASDVPTDIFSTANHLHFSSYFLQKGIQNDIEQIFRKAKMAGVTTSFDTQWDPSEKWEIDLTKILPYVDIFLPNEKELLNLTGKKTIQEAARHLNDFMNTMVVKLGKKGSMSFKSGNELHIPAFINDNVVDAIGAGDSFNAGFIHSFLRNKSLDECQLHGNLMGAYSTTSAGGTTAFDDKANIITYAKEKLGLSHEID